MIQYDTKFLRIIPRIACTAVISDAGVEPAICSVYNGVLGRLAYPSDECAHAGIEPGTSAWPVCGVLPLILSGQCEYDTTAHHEYSKHVNLKFRYMQ